MSSGQELPTSSRSSELIGAEGIGRLQVFLITKGYRSIRAPRTSAESRRSGCIRTTLYNKSDIGPSGLRAQVLKVALQDLYPYFCSMTIDQIFCQDDESAVPRRSGSRPAYRLRVSLLQPKGKSFRAAAFSMFTSCRGSIRSAALCRGKRATRFPQRIPGSQASLL